MADLTPIMEQYLRIKAKYRDAVLFFRIGDFYEMFYEDAKLASEVLGLTLTSREHGKSEKVPLAGIPHHSLETYLARLIRAGYKVAICEQVEDPRSTKGLVRREVVEVVTPGTALSETLLEDKQNNYLVSICQDGASYGFSVVDLSTGEFLVTELDQENLLNELEQLRPAEVVVPANWLSEDRTVPLGHFPNLTISRGEDWTFSYDYAYETLKNHFGTASLKGFGCEDLTLGIRAAGAVLNYLKETKKGTLPHISRICRYSTADFMVIDATTQRNLELITTLQGESRKGTLLSILDRTRTAMGGRLLRNWLLKPLIRVPKIEARLDAVEELYSDSSLRNQVREELKSVGDLERLVARVSCGRATPRELVALKQSVKVVPRLREVLAEVKSSLLLQLRGELVETDDLVTKIGEALVDDPPSSLTEGGIIRPGYDPYLDQLREISRGGKDWIARLQQKERERTGIVSLKVGYNKVFGYYIEVTRPNLNRVPPDYIRKQTIVNAERFITPELKEYEARVLSAEEQICDLEYELFLRLREEVARETPRIQAVARAMAQLDVLASLAEVAVAYEYRRPWVDEGDSILITDGRHPVVERLLSGEPFVPNDTKLDNQTDQILIITGPNMAGKSTYLRQVGLIVLLAQMGSFVPAREAHIGVVDRIFTRVGASDSIAGGESTFLVEMNETANIIHNATPRSLVLLDEIGRGTSTFDGLSIAWAVTEYLHDHPRVAAKTLFATHYHELTELEFILPRVKNYNVAVQEWEDEVVFLRKIVQGGCDHSYGIQVARLAGLPQEVVERAKEVLANLEENELTPNRVPRIARGKRAPKFKQTGQLELFAPTEQMIAEELRHLNLSCMTPLEALNKLDEWQKKLNARK